MPPQPCSHPRLRGGRCPGPGQPPLPTGVGSQLSQQPRCRRSSRALFWAPCSFACWHGAARPAWSRSLSPQDDQIERERASQRLSGGCCALAAVYLMGKFYVANAGDSRYGPAGQPPPFAWQSGSTLVEQGSGEHTGMAGEEQPAPSLKLGWGRGQQGQAEPPPASPRAPGTAFAHCTEGTTELPPKIWDLLPAFLAACRLLPRWRRITPQPLLPVPAWAASRGVKIALGKAVKNVQEVILGHASHQ